MAHDKTYVMELYNQASQPIEPVPIVDNSLVQVLPGVPLVPPNLLPEDDQCPYCQRFFPNLESVQNHILEKHSEHCKFCNMTIQGNFEEHLFNSHYKQKLYDVIPSQTRGCSGEKTKSLNSLIL